MAGFSVNIGADVKQLTAGLNHAKQDLNNFGKSVQNTSTALTVIRPGANQAANALGNLSRVAQDAPFGFIGIQNNLNPLLESFQRLKTETGSSGAALKALGGSLLGAGGIGFALAAVSSLITVSVQKYGSLGNAIKELFGTLNNLEKANNALSKAQNEANKNAGEEIARIKILAAVSADITRSTEKRGQATDELQKILKANNVELSREAILNGQSAEAIDKATDAILKRARARAIEARLSDLQTQRLDLELKESNAITNLTNKQAQFNKELKAGRLDERSRGFFLRTAVDELDEVKNGLKDIDEQIKFTLDKVNADKVDPIDPKTVREGTDLLKKRLEALEKIKAVTKDMTALVGLQESIFELQVKIAIRDQGKNQLSKQEVDQQIKGYQDQLNETFKNQAIELEAIPKVKFSQVVLADITQKDISSVIAKATGFDKKIPIPTEFEIDVRFLGLRAAQLKKAKKDIEKELSENIADIKFQGKIDLFTGLGEAIGEALATQDFGGGIKKAAQSMLGIIGGILQQIGKQVITAALAIKALKTTLEKFAIANPALAVIAGIGLVALGSALKNVKFDGPKFAHGGIVTGPIIGQIGEQHRPEVIMPLDRLPQMLRSIGGGGGNDLQMVPIINNEGLYLAVQRGARRTGRKF